MELTTLSCLIHSLVSLHNNKAHLEQYQPLDIHALPVVSSYLIHNLVRLRINKAHQTISAALLYTPCPRLLLPAAIGTQLAGVRPLPAA
jgi:hypothetical protein